MHLLHAQHTERGVRQLKRGVRQLTQLAAGHFPTAAGLLNIVTCD